MQNLVIKQKPTIYWLAIAQLLYERCCGSIFEWKSLSSESQLNWVKIAQEANKLLRG